MISSDFEWQHFWRHGAQRSLFSTVDLLVKLITATSLHFSFRFREFLHEDYKWCVNETLLPPTKEEVNAFVCLSVGYQDYSKTHAWIWMKCCVSTDVGTWTNWLTFESDPDYSPDAGTGLLSPISYKRWYVEFYVGKIRRIRIGRCSDAWFYNGFNHWASGPSKHLCRRYMRSTECPSSYLIC